MTKRLAILTLAIGLIGAWSYTDYVDTTVRQFLYAFNQGGNVKRALAVCAPQTWIIDEIEPYHWQSCSAWHAAYVADLKKRGITERVVTPSGDEVGGRDDKARPPVAYVVKRLKVTFWHGGQRLLERDVVFMCVLKFIAGSWRIVVWTWSNPSGGAVCIEGACAHSQPFHQPAPSSTPMEPVPPPTSGPHF